MRVVTLFIAGVLVFCPQLSAFKSYKGIEVWSVEIIEEEVRDLLVENNIDVWSQSSTQATIKVEPHFKTLLQTELRRMDVQYIVSNQDLDALIQDEHERLHSREDRELDLNVYNSYENISQYLMDVAESNPFASVYTIGKSVEDRDLWVIKFSVGAGKPAVWIDCGIHAREWLTQSTCVWGVNLLDQQYGSNVNVTTLLDAYDVHILPVYNPDGYAYTWSDDRLWRKNRSNYTENECIGVDLNRNFDDHFGGNGTSNDSCSEIYTGPNPESEPETQHVAATILDLKDNHALTVMFSLHAFAQLWMYPWGWTNDLPADNEEIERVAIEGMNALMSVYGTEYEQGSIANAIYVDSGSSTDWSYAKGLIQTHTIEVRPDKGPGSVVGGFKQDESEIYPTALETWIGMMAAIRAV